MRWKIMIFPLKDVTISLMKCPVGLYSLKNDVSVIPIPKKIRLAHKLKSPNTRITHYSRYTRANKVNSMLLPAVDQPNSNDKFWCLFTILEG